MRRQEILGGHRMKNVLLLAMSTLPRDIEEPNYFQYENADG